MVLNLLLHAFASLAANRCYCLEFKIPGAGVTPDSHISAPHGVVGGSAPRTELTSPRKMTLRDA
jgi:hypothetical protein